MIQFVDMTLRDEVADVLSDWPGYVLGRNIGERTLDPDFDGSVTEADKHKIEHVCGQYASAGVGAMMLDFERGWWTTLHQRDADLEDRGRRVARIATLLNWIGDIYPQVMFGQYMPHRAEYWHRTPSWRSFVMQGTIIAASSGMICGSAYVQYDEPILHREWPHLVAQVDAARDLSLTVHARPPVIMVVNHRVAGQGQPMGLRRWRMTIRRLLAAGADGICWWCQANEQFVEFDVYARVLHEELDLTRRLRDERAIGIGDPIGTLPPTGDSPVVTTDIGDRRPSGGRAGAPALPSEPTSSGRALRQEREPRA